MEPVLYLDHAATTPVLPEALEEFVRVCRELYANPSSLHGAGAAAARRLEEARSELRRAAGAEGYRVVWTATGTESNHLGIQGLARRLRGRVRPRTPRVLAGALEHPAALEAARALEAEGFRVETVPADREGRILPEALEPLLDGDVVLVAVQWVNNELGSLHPVAALVERVRRRAPQAAFHVDAVQALGKIRPTVASTGADSVAVAAHKIGGVRGCAALFLREGGPEPRPLFRGGGHEGGLRSGTENVAGAAAFARAARLRREALESEPERFLRRRRLLLEALRRAHPGLRVLGPEAEDRIQGGILSCAFPGAPAEPLLHHLESQGVLVGSGSACHRHGASDSPVLVALGLPRELRSSVLRFSLSGSETEAELRRAGEAVARALRELRVAAPGGG